MRHFDISTVSAAALITAATALGCDRSADLTAPSTSARSDRVAAQVVKQVPFKVTFNATSTAADVPRCPVLTVEVHGTGHATHLGRLTVDQSNCAAPLGTTFAITDGEFTLTAANGDQVVGAYFGELVPLAPPLFSIDGAFTITGGTGRFTGATGGGDVSGVQNFATGEATISLVGTVSSVGSTKSSP
jgi:hypothetical protein